MSTNSSSNPSVEPVPSAPNLSVECRSPVFLRLYRFDLHLVPIFLFGLVSRCIGQEHVHLGLDFTLDFRFRSSCSVFGPRSGASSCSRASPISSWIFHAKVVVPSRCCFHQCIKSSTPDLIFCCCRCPSFVLLWCFSSRVGAAQSLLPVNSSIFACSVCGLLQELVLVLLLNYWIEKLEVS
jgi:hypothetical protein